MLRKFNVRLPKDPMERLRQEARRTGMPMSRIVHEFVETALNTEKANPLMEFAGVIEACPAKAPSRKGYSRRANR